MAGKRSYDDPCGIARALDVLGERWALLVVRELVLGPKRFTDLRSHLRGIATDVLSQRLRQLEDAGVLQQAPLPPPASGRVYQLTDRGRELEPVLHALGRWGSRQPLPPGREMTVDAFAVALATVFERARVGDLEATVAMRIDDDRLVAQVGGGTLELRRGVASEPDASLDADVPTLREVLWRGRPLADAEAAGDLRIEGSRRVVRRFVAGFPPPVPALTSN
jgi:DNA-binding HxlR family transcriptional regulator